jgi:glycosyltransferase involved in cell wall biosynthesis
MKILNVITGLNVISGGPSVSTYSLVTGMRKSGVDVKILTNLPSLGEEYMINKDEFIIALQSPKLERFGYNKDISVYLRKNEYSLYHGHGLWQHPVHAMSKMALKYERPYIISPRGMLHPEALKKSALLKKIALSVYQRKDLRNAHTIHATSMQEVEFIRLSGFQNPIALIPNSIEIPDFPDYINNKIRRVGFIGRFDPIKNIEKLLIAWSGIEHKFDDIELVLIGDGPIEYRKKLETLCNNLMIRHVIFTGFLTGSERELIFSTLSYLVLPSKSENFGMVVPEALSRRIPVISSKGTPWEELNSHNAGWWIEADVESLIHALTQALSLNEKERVLMGINGRALVEKKYSSESIAKQMINLYGWILGNGSKPDFVFT